MGLHFAVVGRPHYFGQKRMPPDEWYLRVQKGITAGLVPPTPSAIHILSKSEQDDFIKVISVVRPLGKPTRITAPTPTPSCKPVQTTLPLIPPTSGAFDNKVVLLTAELHCLLKTLPTELPRGSEDIYGSDVGLIWRSKDLEWCNMSMAMVARGTPGTEGFDFDELALAIGLLGSDANIALERARNGISNVNRNDEGELTEAEAINHLNSGIGIGGSGGYVSLVKAKDDEKKWFGRVVEIIDTLLALADGSIDLKSVSMVPFIYPSSPKSKAKSKTEKDAKGKISIKDIVENMAIVEEARQRANVNMDVEEAETSNTANTANTVDTSITSNTANTFNTANTANTANTDALSPDNDIMDVGVGESSSGVTTRAREKARDGGGKVTKASLRKEKERTEINIISAAGRRKWKKQ